MSKQILGKVVPQRGTDYWTNADKEEIIQAVSNEVEDKKQDYIDNANTYIEELTTLKNSQLAEFNTNAETKTGEFNSLVATEKGNIESLVDDKKTELTTKANTLNSNIDTNAENKISVFNSNAQEKTSQFNSNAATQTLQFTENVTTKEGEYNSNATAKLSEYNSNASEKLESYNTNASGTIEAYNTNATSKLSDYNTNANTKLDDYNSNATTKLNAYNQNATSKLSDYNTNANTKLETYNTNATTKLDNFNSNAEEKTEEFNSTANAQKIVDTRNELERVKNDILETGSESNSYIHVEDSTMAELQELEVDGVCKQNTTTGTNLLPVALNDVSETTQDGLTYSVSNNKIKIKGTTTNSSNLEFVLSNQFALDGGTYNLRNSQSIKPTVTFYKSDWSGINLPQNQTSAEISLDATTNFKNIIRIWYVNNTTVDYEGYIWIATDNISQYEPYSGGQPSPNPLYPQDISVIEESLKITTTNGLNEENANYLYSQINANLGDESIAKINDKYKDTLQIKFNEEDGNYHLIIKKAVGKRILNGSESWSIYGDSSCTHKGYACANQSKSNTEICVISNKFVSKTATYIWSGDVTGIANSLSQIIIRCQDTSITTVENFKTWLSSNNVEIYYALATPYEVDLGAIEMPLSYDDTTNIFTDSELLPSINATYYRNFTKTIQNLQVNEKSLKQELIDINSRLSAIETSQASLLNESEGA